MRYIILLLVVFIAACGPSQKEKEEIAKVTCAIIGETRNMDAAIRVEKMNEARKQIGGSPFSMSDTVIKAAVYSNSCEELVLESKPCNDICFDGMKAYSSTGVFPLSECTDSCLGE